MKSEQINNHFQKLKQQRDAFYHDSAISFTNAWSRPMPDKWSIGETLYHLVLMTKLFRRFSVIYIPLMQPVAYIRRNKAYKTEIHDIYQEFRNQKKRPMNAPFPIKPPDDLEGKWKFDEVQALLENETDKLMRNLNDMEQNIAGQIYYPDPIAGYPNLVQCVHLLGIHEQHHFTIVKKYYND